MFQLKQLENGLTILGEPDPQAQTVALGYFVRTGSRDETPEELGAAHFIEHLLFKGQDLHVRFDTLGAQVNAFTSEETTVYHAACLPEYALELLELLSALLEPTFDLQDIERERQVILEEIAMYEDDPESRAIELLRERTWLHPLGRRILGTPQTVRNLSQERLANNFNARYGAANITLVACGQFEWDALVKKASELSAHWSAGTFQRHFPSIKRAWGKHVVHDPHLTRTQFALLAPGLAAHHPLREAAVVLAEILGGEHGRLYWSLIDTGKADSVDFAHTEFEDSGIFESSWSCDSARADETLALVCQEPLDITQDEVTRARKKLAVSAALQAQTPYSRLFSLGMDYLYLEQPLTVEQTVARFEKVSLAEVQAVLEMRPFDHLSILKLGPH